MNQTKNGNLRTIANEINCSITTVSRALSGSKQVAESTRQKVLDAARHFRYRPNLLIKGMQTGKTGNIGVMVPPYNSYWTKILNGIHDNLVQHNYAPITLWCDTNFENRGDEKFVLDQIYRLLDRRVDGIILWPQVSNTYGEHMEELEARDLPVVTIDHELSFADSVETDEFTGAKLVVEHLYSLGHRRFGHLAGDKRWKWAELRRKYFEKLVSELPGTERVVVEEGLYEEDAPEAARELLSKNPMPTAIFASSDSRAFMLYKIANEMGIKIPQDVSIVGYSDSHEFVQLVQPQLTTVRQKPYYIGFKATQVLLDRIDGKLNEAPKRLNVGCDLIVRGSTATVKH